MPNDLTLTVDEESMVRHGYRTNRQCSVVHGGGEAGFWFPRFRSGSGPARAGRSTTGT
jgi:hypothetical protein